MGDITHIASVRLAHEDEVEAVSLLPFVETLERMFFSSFRCPEIGVDQAEFRLLPAARPRSRPQFSFIISRPYAPITLASQYPSYLLPVRAFASIITTTWSQLGTSQIAASTRPLQKASLGSGIASGALNGALRGSVSDQKKLPCWMEGSSCKRTSISLGRCTPPSCLPSPPRPTAPAWSLSQPSVPASEQHCSR